jgi:starvation-inducible outer membrane lipoprotein
MKTAIALITAAMLTGCVTVTPEMKGRGCNNHDAAQLAGMQVGANMRGGTVAPEAEAVFLELRVRCGK